MLLFYSISSLSAWLPKIKTKLAILASSLHLVPDFRKKSNCCRHFDEKVVFML
jgi:hypothetical protein